MKILVTGAAGYIGSVVTQTLIDGGHDVVAFDNLKSGYRAAVDARANFVQGDILSERDLDRAFHEQDVEAVCHLAGEIAVHESATDPGLHFRANACGGISVADAMVRHGIKKIVFSSTAAVYGEPDKIPLDEDSRTEPGNAYGETKLQFERALKWYGQSHGIGSIILRYFNACGATDRNGEWREKESHIIPILFEVVLGQRPHFTLFGTDYETADGTCVRDYIHVRDIAAAHMAALEALTPDSRAIFNVGIGAGYTNRQVLETARRVTGHAIPCIESERRPGDTATLIASSEKIRRELGWKPIYPGLEGMVESAWAWRSRHPRGYASE